MHRLWSSREAVLRPEAPRRRPPEQLELLGLHELLVTNDEIKLMIYRKAKAMEIREVAIQQGMRTLKQDGIEKVLKGHTSLARVREVCSR